MPVGDWHTVKMQNCCWSTLSQNHRICWVEGTLKDPRVQFPSPHNIVPKSHTISPRLFSKLLLNSVTLGAVTIPLGNLFSAQPPLWMKDLFLITSLNPLTQLQAIPSSPVTGYHGKETSVCPRPLWSCWRAQGWAGSPVEPLNDRSPVSVTPFTVALCAWPLSQLLTPHIICLSSCELDIFSRRAFQYWRANTESFTEIQRDCISWLGGLFCHERKSGLISRTFPSWTCASRD